MRTPFTAFYLVLSLIVLVLGTNIHADEQKRELTCSKCNMKIAETGKKFSVIMPKAPGMDSSAFDDIGCAVVFRNKECASRQTAFDSNAVTHDYETGEQVPLEKAFFAVSAGVKTPMGYDIAAFKDRGQAEKLAAGRPNAKVLKWFEVVDLDLK